MIWSGLLIYWANQAYRIGWGDTTLLKFFPDSFNKALHIPYRLAEGMGIHFAFMWLFAMNGMFYVLYLLLSGQWKWLFPNKKSLSESRLVLLNDLGIKKMKITPASKYNGAQRILYTGVLILGFLSLASGFAIYKPVQLNWLCASMGGYGNARFIHFLITLLFVLFFLIHIIQVIRAGWNSFQSMVTGLHILSNDEKEKSDS